MSLFAQSLRRTGRPAVHAIRALGDRLAEDGAITLISGALADRPNAYGTAFLATASAAMEALGRGFALELAPRAGEYDFARARSTRPFCRRHLGLKKLPLHRLGTAAEAGAAVVFLMESCWMNGTTLNVDGGSRLV